MESKSIKLGKTRRNSASRLTRGTRSGWSTPLLAAPGGGWAGTGALGPSPRIDCHMRTRPGTVRKPRQFLLFFFWLFKGKQNRPSTRLRSSWTPLRVPVTDALWQGWPKYWPAGQYLKPPKKQHRKIVNHEITTQKFNENAKKRKKKSNYVVWPAELITE